MAVLTPARREQLHRRGLRLEWFTVAWNVVEAFVAIGVLAANEARDLTEPAASDAKASLPAKGKSKDLAIDVAAAANDSGTLLIGAW